MQDRGHMQSLDTPDVSPVQKLVSAGLVLLAAILSLVNAFNWAEVSAEEGAAVTAVYVAFSGFAVLADAIIRNGRSRSYLNAPKGVVADGSEEGVKTTGRRSTGGA